MLCGKNVVFHGTAPLSKKVARTMVQELKGCVQKKLTAETDVLVVGHRAKQSQVVVRAGQHHKDLVVWNTQQLASKCSNLGKGWRLVAGYHEDEGAFEAVPDDDEPCPPPRRAERGPYPFKDCMPEGGYPFRSCTVIWPLDACRDASSPAEGGDDCSPKTGMGSDLTNPPHPDPSTACSHVLPSRPYDKRS